MNILFIGCVISSYRLLNELLTKGKNICGVITKKQSEINADFVDLTSLCEEYQVPVCYYSADKYKECVDFAVSCAPEIIYCFGWSHLLKEDMLLIPKLGAVGFHPAPLPKSRGRHPIIWTLALGLETTASTFFMLTSKIDDGDIVSQEEVPVFKADTSAALYERIIKIANKQVICLTDAFESSSVVFKKQSAKDSSVWRKREKKDGQIDFRMGAETIYNLIRALTKPYVGAHFVYKDKEYKVWASEIISDSSNKYADLEFGKVIEVFSFTSFLVKTGCGLLKITDCDKIILYAGDYL